MFQLAVAAPGGLQRTFECQYAATMDFEIYVRQDTSLTVRNSRWPVSNQRVVEPLLGRPLLQFLELNII